MKAGVRQYDSNRFETNGHTDPRDGGCPNCGRSTSLVTLADFGPKTGQFCPHCGLIDATSKQATADGSKRPASQDGDEAGSCYRDYGEANR